MKKRISAILAAVMAACSLTAVIVACSLGSCSPLEISAVPTAQPLQTSLISSVISATSETSPGTVTSRSTAPNTTVPPYTTAKRTTSVTPPTSYKDIRPGFENATFDGHVFTFATPLGTGDGWADYEVYAEEGGAGIMDEAIVQRNYLLIWHYDCSIRAVDIEDGALRDDFNTNRNTVDIVLDRYGLGDKANGDYYNLHDFEFISFKEVPWFDANFIEDMTVDGKLYALLGAFSLTSFDATWVMFYNKTAKENSLSLRDVDLYGLVYDGKWTLDKFYELSKLAALNGSMPLYGLASDMDGIRGLYFGAGQSFIDRSDQKNGTTAFASAFDATAAEVTDKIISIYADVSTMISDSASVEMFMRGNTVLFSPNHLRMASYYAGKQGKYSTSLSVGILPYPALTEEQSAAREYRHAVDERFIYMCVPRTCTDLARIIDFIEVYAYHSYYIVYKDYINLYKYTYTTDTDSAVMVDFIMNTRCFDLAYHLDLEGFDGEYTNGIRSGTNIIAEAGDSYGEAIVKAANRYREGMKSAGY